MIQFHFTVIHFIYFLHNLIKPYQLIHDDRHSSAPRRTKSSFLLPFPTPHMKTEYQAVYKFEVQSFTNSRFITPQTWGSILNKFEVQYSTNLRFNTQQIWGLILHKFEVQYSTNLRFQYSTNLRFNTPQKWVWILHKFEVQFWTNLRFNTQQIWGSILHKF